MPPASDLVGLGTGGIDVRMLGLLVDSNRLVLFSVNGPGTGVRFVPPADGPLLPPGDGDSVGITTGLTTLLGRSDIVSNVATISPPAEDPLLPPGTGDTAEVTTGTPLPGNSVVKEITPPLGMPPDPPSTGNPDASMQNSPP